MRVTTLILRHRAACRHASPLCRGMGDAANKKNDASSLRELRGRISWRGSSACVFGVSGSRCGPPPAGPRQTHSRPRRNLAHLAGRALRNTSCACVHRLRCGLAGRAHVAGSQSTPADPTSSARSRRRRQRLLRSRAVRCRNSAFIFLGRSIRGMPPRIYRCTDPNMFLESPAKVFGATESKRIGQIRECAIVIS